MQADPEQMRNGDAAEEDLYALLGVPPNASSSELKRAWHRLAARYHPDTRAEVSENEPVAIHDKQHPVERFLQVHRAYTILGDPTRRQAYDDELAAKQLQVALPQSIAPAPPYQKLRGRFPQHHAMLHHLALSISRLSGCCRHFRQALLYHPLARFLRTHMAPWMHRMAALPWASLMRVRALGAAFVCGLLYLWATQPSHTPTPSAALQSVASFQTAPAWADAEAMATRSSPVLPAPPGGPSTAAGKRNNNSLARHTESVQQVASRSAEPKRQRLSARPVHNPQQPLATEERPANQSAGSLAVDMAVLSPESRPSLVSQFPDWSQPLARTPDHEPAARVGNWLAGCRSPDGKIWQGQLRATHDGTAFSWGSISKDTAYGSVNVALEEGITSVENAHRPARSNSSGVRLVQSGGRLARIKLTADTLPEVPCRTWTLASRDSADWLAGRWISAERAGSETRESIRPKFLQLLLNPGPKEVVGHFRGLYTIQSGAAGLPVTRSATILPEVEFRLHGNANDFNGSLRWQQPDYGDGVLTVVPLSETSLAIHWKAQRLVPGRLQLSGSTEVLYRRSAH
jgi:hypothetical protein